MKISVELNSKDVYELQRLKNGSYYAHFYQIEHPIVITEEQFTILMEEWDDEENLK